MTKAELTAAVESFKTETRNAMQVMHDALNAGQQKKIVKDEAVKMLFDCYGVNYESQGEE